MQTDELGQMDRDNLYPNFMLLAMLLTMTHSPATADLCKADQPDYTVAIAVGIVLLILILIVILAYACSRRRRTDGYQSL